MNLLKGLEDAEFYNRPLGTTSCTHRTDP